MSIWQSCRRLILTILVINLTLSSVAFANTKENAKFAEKIKANIVKLDTGKDAKIQVKLKDGTKLKGYVGQINENTFVVINDKTGSATEIPYPNAKQIKGNNLSTGVKIAIAVGIVAALVVIISIVGNSID